MRVLTDVHPGNSKCFSRLCQHAVIKTMTGFERMRKVSCENITVYNFLENREKAR